MGQDTLRSKRNLGRIFAASAVVLGLVVSGAVMASDRDKDRPTRRVTATEAAAQGDPAAIALKAAAVEAKAAVTKVDALVAALEKSVNEVDAVTGKIANKSDLAAVEEAGRKIDSAKTFVAKVDKEAEGLRGAAVKMDREIKKLK